MIILFHGKPDSFLLTFWDYKRIGGRRESMDMDMPSKSTRYKPTKRLLKWSVVNIYLLSDDSLESECSVNVVREWHSMGDNCRFQGDYRHILCQCLAYFTRNVEEFRVFLRGKMVMTELSWSQCARTRE